MSAVDTMIKIMDEGADYYRTYYTYIGISKDKGETLFQNAKYACHAILGTYAGHCPTDLYTSLSVATKGLQKDANDFWAFITDPDKSPWKSALKGSEVIKNKDGNPYLLCLKTDAPAQIIGNLCIATRIPMENPGVLKAWALWRKLGLDEYEALAAANLVSLNSKGDTTITMIGGHYPFDNPGYICMKKLRSGTPTTNGKLFKNGAHYGPSNVIWYPDTLKYETTYGAVLKPPYTHPLYKQVTGKGVYDGVFGKRYQMIHKYEPIAALPADKLGPILLENRGSL